MNSIAMFIAEAEARLCFHYARSRHPNAKLTLHHAAYAKWPWDIAIEGVTGFDNQCAISFIKGAAYMLGDRSCIIEVMCKGDERDRYPYAEG